MARHNMRDNALRIDTMADRFNFREDDDDYFSQPRALFNSFTDAQKQRLFENTARGISGASEETIERHLNNCTAADPAYGAGVRAAIEALNKGEAPKGNEEGLTADPEDTSDLL